MTIVKKLPKRTCIICKSKHLKRSMIRLAALDGEVKLDLESRLDGRGINICLSKDCRLSELDAGKLSYSIKTVVTKESTASVSEQLRKLVSK